MKLFKITPDTYLATGTNVKVKNLIGVVINSKYVNAVPSGCIVVHTILFTSEIKFKRLQSGVGFSTTIKIKNLVKDVNYSFIEVINAAI